jgi:hypothetical protein
MRNSSLFEKSLKFLKLDLVDFDQAADQCPALKDACLSLKQALLPKPITAPLPIKALNRLLILGSLSVTE